MANQQKEHGEAQRERIAELYGTLAGNISAIAREMGIARATVREHIQKMGGIKKPLVSGSLKGVVEVPKELPSKGSVKRYILTSAQNNTLVNEPFWNNLLALAEHYDAKIMVGTYSYNQNAYGELAVKQGTKKAEDKKLWFDPKITEYISDQRVELGQGLVWCGEMNILPTAEQPLSGLETYSHRKSAIFPHAKLAMRSIPTMQGEGTKLNYTTGTVTLRNYIQKKAGLKAEHHHRYSALVVEVNHDGYWAVRQVGSSSSGEAPIQDLNVIVQDGKVTSTKGTVEAITWGDLHATIVDPVVEKLSQEMIDTLKPKYQFIHDAMEGISVNHHEAKNPHAKFKAFLRGYDSVQKELDDTMAKISAYDRFYSEVFVVDSNHDNWLERWLREHDYKQDPKNAVLFLEAQLAKYQSMVSGDDRFHLLEWAMQKGRCTPRLKFLRADESVKICDRKIECGQHGHLGPNGARGNPQNLSKVGRRANTAHTHSAGIWDGLYVAGTSSKLKWEYSHGPTSWSHSHIVTYSSGQRTIVTMYSGKWRA